MEGTGVHVNIHDEVMDKAYAVFEEWGPNQMKERDERLKEEFPTLTDEEIHTIIKKMKAISSTVWKIAEMGGEAKMMRSKIVKMLQNEHPFLKDKGLRHAIFLVNYYAWHEGYDK